MKTMHHRLGRHRKIVYICLLFTAFSRLLTCNFNSESKMTPHKVTGIIGTKNMPTTMLGLSSLHGVDYADQFSITTGIDATPEQWARAIFGNVPSTSQVFIWRYLLGLRISRDREASSTTVAGWKIGGEGQDFLRLEANSWLLSGNLVVHRTDSQVSLVTLVQYETWIAWPWWCLLGLVHRKIVPVILRRAVGRIQASQ